MSEKLTNGQPNTAPTTNEEPLSVAEPHLQQLVLDNGITLIVIENQAADIISGRFFFKQAGTIAEKRDRAGLAHLTSAVITKGTEKLSALDIAEKVESIGAGLGADAATDYFLFSLKTVAADFPAMLKLLAEIVRSPSFPTAEVELERKLTIQNIRSQQEQPFNVAFNQLRQQMYGEHPYGVSALGTESSVAELTRQDLQQFHQTYFRPDRLVISLSGRITPDTAVSLIRDVFGDWKAPTNPLPKPQFPTLTANPFTAEIVRDTQQAIVMLGYLGTSVDCSDYPVLKLISTYLGNGLSSRLFVELREKRGLAYDVSAFYPTRLEPAPFITYMGTAPKNIEVAIAGLRDEVKRLSEVKLSEAELQGAKNKLLGQYALGKQTNSELAQIYGWYETLGLKVEYDRNFQEAIAKVTGDKILEVANRYLDRPYLSLVKPQ
ncbi:pitrilysin family protein [Myxosarcina sp. GI1]|uniref:M16 family metallopeptidase n=1 Tax=Myxosarcina sp. GI1 TaxID=1541065 RepID=UPI0009DDF0E1|nr:pitrilysin family protein [Myxosarcina sp. GI1]